MEPLQSSGLLLQAKAAAESEHRVSPIILEAEQLPQIEGNKEQILFLYQQLFSNAIQFRKPEAPVIVKVDVSTLRLNTFRQLRGNYNYTEFLKLQVQDNGIGFEDQYGQQAFELFRKLHPQSGLGVGLALCKKIVENHNGFIRVKSKPGEGATFKIYLPFK